MDVSNSKFFTATTHCKIQTNNNGNESVSLKSEFQFVNPGILNFRKPTNGMRSKFLQSQNTPLLTTRDLTDI